MAIERRRRGAKVPNDRVPVQTTTSPLHEVRIPGLSILFSFAFAIVAIASALSVLYWQVVVFAVFGGVTQQVHRFAHAPTIRLPRFILFLQKIRVLQDGRHHWVHHTPPHLTRYCVATPWINPVLDKINFWRFMERMFVPVFGAPRRPDLVDRSWYRSTAERAR